MMGRFFITKNKYFKTISYSCYLAVCIVYREPFSVTEFPLSGKKAGKTRGLGDAISALLREIHRREPVLLSSFHLPSLCEKGIGNPLSGNQSRIIGNEHQMVRNTGTGSIGSGPIGKNPRKLRNFRKPAPVFFAFVFNREFHGHPDICPDSTLAAFLMPRAREGTGQGPLNGMPNNHPHPTPRILTPPPRRPS